MKNQLPKKKANRINSLKTNMTICSKLQIRVTLNISGTRWSNSHQMYNHSNSLIKWTYCKIKKKRELNQTEIPTVDPTRA